MYKNNDELRARADSLDRAWARERHVDVGFDRAWPRAHHQDAVGEDHRLVDTVGDEQHRLAGRLPEAEQLVLQQQACLLVQRAERLVHQKQLRIDGEGAHDRDALAHALGELRRIGVQEIAEPDLVSQRSAISSRSMRDTPRISNP